MEKEILEAFEKQAWELELTKVELSNKKLELEIANGEMWNQRCKEEAELERDIQLERLAYFKKLNEGSISPTIK